jgi:hypothetical protein
VNTKFNPETDIVFAIDQKIRGKQIPINAKPAVVSEVAVPAPVQPVLPPPVVIPKHVPAEVARVLPQDMSLVFFEFQIPIFANWCQQNANGLKRSYQVVTDLAVLTSELKKKIPIALFLPFSVAPKAMEQLVGQISTKFLHVKLVLIALEPWAPERIKELQTKYQPPGHVISFAVWPMGVLSVEEILKSN